MRPVGTHISMSARAVVASGEPFVKGGEVYSDPCVARDEISSLRAEQEPIVLRVSVIIADGGEAGDVAGDWLCDVGGVEPVKLPNALSSPDESVRWLARYGPLVEAWGESVRPLELLAAAHGLGLTKADAVAASLAIAELVTPPDGWPRPAASALVAARAWLASGGEVERRAAVAASARAYDDADAEARVRPEGGAIRCAALVAACVSSVNHWSNAIRCADSASVMPLHGMTTPRSHRVALADAIRRGIPTIRVLRVAAGVER